MRATVATMALVVTAAAAGGCGEEAPGMDGGPADAGVDGAAGPFDLGACAPDGAETAVSALPFRTELVLGGGPVRDEGRPTTACSIASSVAAADARFRVEVPGPGVLFVRTDLPGTDPWIDTIVYARDGCGEGSRQLGCNDDGARRGGASRMLVEVEAATSLVVLLDGVSAEDRGAVELLIDFSARPTPSAEGAESCGEATELQFSAGESLRVATAAGDTTGATNELGCAEVPSTFDLPEQFYTFTLDQPSEVIVEVRPGPEFDAAFYLLSSCTADDAAACHDQGPIGTLESTNVTLPAGRWILGIDSFLTELRPDYSEGPYDVRVLVLPEGDGA